MSFWKNSLLGILAMGSLTLVSAANTAAQTNCDHPAKVIIAAGPSEPFDVYEAVYQPDVVVINVSVNTKGNPSAAAIVASSGSISVDHAALRAARVSKYAPAMKNCKPVAGVAVFRVGYGSSNNILIQGAGGNETQGVRPPEE